MPLKKANSLKMLRQLYPVEQGLKHDQLKDKTKFLDILRQLYPVEQGLKHITGTTLTSGVVTSGSYIQ